MSCLPQELSRDLQVVTEAGRELPQLVQRSHLELAGPLGRHRELPPALDERLRGLSGEAETQLEHAAETIVERVQQALDLLPSKALRERRFRIRGSRVHQRLAVQTLPEELLRPPNRPDLAPDVDRYRNHAGMTVCRLVDRLPDEQRCVRGELAPQAVVELLDRSRQRKVPLLDEVEERDVAIRVLARDPDHEAKVGLHQLALRSVVSRILATEELTLLLRREQRRAPHAAKVQLERVLERGARVLLARIAAGRRAQLLICEIDAQRAATPFFFELEPRGRRTRRRPARAGTTASGP